MRYHIRSLTLCVLFVAAISFSAQEKSNPKLRWYGQSFFVIETTKGTRVAFDPHAIEAFGRQTTKADLVLISHPHPDHVRLEVIEIKDKPKVIQGIKVGAGNPEAGPPNRQQWNPVDEQFRDVKVRSIGTFHDSMQGFQRGKNTIFVLEFDGLKLAHLGDLGHLLSEEQLRSLGSIDVLLIPVGGVYTLNGDQAKKVVAQIKPSKYILPMHFGTKTFDDLLPVDEFLDGQTNVERKPATNELILDRALQPKQPQIVLLGWKKD